MSFCYVLGPQLLKLSLDSAESVFLLVHARKPIYLNFSSMAHTLYSPLFYFVAFSEEAQIKVTKDSFSVWVSESLRRECFRTMLFRYVPPPSIKSLCGCNHVLLFCLPCLVCSYIQKFKSIFKYKKRLIPLVSCVLKQRIKNTNKPTKYLIQSRGPISSKSVEWHWDAEPWTSINGWL